MIGWKRKNSRAARACTYIDFFDVVCQTTKCNFQTMNLSFSIFSSTAFRCNQLICILQRSSSTIQNASKRNYRIGLRKCLFQLRFHRHGHRRCSTCPTFLVKLSCVRWANRFCWSLTWGPPEFYPEHWIQYSNNKHAVQILTLLNSTKQEFQMIKLAVCS